MAFWLLISGRVGKAIPKGLEEGRIFVGRQETPIAIIKRKDIQSYITPEFLGYYQSWSRFNAGLGLPWGDGWAKYPEHYIQVIQLFQNEWRIATNGKNNRDSGS